MKTSKTLIVYFLVLLLGASGFSACGAAGSSGPQGDGKPGADGTDDGKPGADGTESPDNGGSTSAGNPALNSASFNLQGAIGLAIAEPDGNGSSLKVNSAMTGLSNLKRINPDHSLTDAVSSGSITVQNFMVAAGNQIYLLLKTPVDNCILVRVSGATNEATCVDPDLSAVNGTNAFGSPIQFDGDGSVYYQGRTADGATVLRQNVAGATTDLINENISLKGFLVLKDGTVFVAGQTESTGAEWTRRITPSSTVENILTRAPAFLALFPDDDIYYGITGGVNRYLMSLASIDPLAWISEDGSGAVNDCPINGSDCSLARSILRTTNGKVFATVPNLSGMATLVQYFPSVVLTPTSIANITVAKPILTYLFLAGVNGNTNKLSLYETNADDETDLLGPENIEVYHINYLNSSSHQIVMFDGLRFTDNKYVLCQVDLTAGNTLTCSKTGLSKLTDFQLFE